MQAVQHVREGATALSVWLANGELDKCSLFSFLAACWHIFQTRGRH